MRIQWQDYNEVTVIDLRGEVDGELTESLRSAVTEIAGNQRAGIVLDMSNVSFLDSQGLELLLWVRDYCRQNKIQLRLAGLDENCGKILEITRLQDEFDCHAELAKAVKSFA
ncbi:MAG TPA: STAS domain-containing protein [Sedimentisphaerales bacterium]|nr:STAS domain-containing protein [Sedimentisphaerales bacterium]